MIYNLCAEAPPDGSVAEPYRVHCHPPARRRVLANAPNERRGGGLPRTEVRRLFLLSPNLRSDGRHLTYCLVRAIDPPRVLAVCGAQRKTQLRS